MRLVAKASAAMVMIFAALSASAQWLTQTNVIPPGWSAVYLYVDASSQNLNTLTGGTPIDQIWLWKVPASPAQYITSQDLDPLSPAGSSRWLTYYSPALGQASSFSSLVPNTGYLVHNTSTSNFTWRVQGHPVPPEYVWDNTGLNLIGYDTPYASPPSWQSFLAPVPALASRAQIYQYVGGPFNAQNPAPVYAQYTTPVTRGQAFWVAITNVVNPWFGPFSLQFPNPGGLLFGSGGGQMTFYLQNNTANPLTVSAKMMPSETPPGGQTPIVGVPPLLLEGALNSSNLTYAYTPLSLGAATTWTLAPAGQSGAEVRVVVGVNAFALTNASGSLYAGILQFTDSLGDSEVDVPVSATATNLAGLWVGSASISQVSQYLKSYATNADGSYQVSTVTNLVNVTTPNVLATTNFVVNNVLNTNYSVVTNYTQDLVISTFTNFPLLAVTATNFYVLATNEVVTLAVTNAVIQTTVVTNVTVNASGGLTFQTATTSTTNLSYLYTTNYFPYTSLVAGLLSTNPPLKLTNNFALIYNVQSNALVYTNGMDQPVVLAVAAFTNYFITNGWWATNTEVAFALTTTNYYPEVTGSQTNYPFTTTTTNLVTLAISNSFMIQSSSAIATTTSVYVANPPYVFTNVTAGVTNWIVYTIQTNTWAYNYSTNFSAFTNLYVCSNAYNVVVGATNFAGGMTNLAGGSSTIMTVVSASYATNDSVIVSVLPAFLTLPTQVAVLSSNYIVASLNTNLGAVVTPYPMRLILHSDGTNCLLLQRVYYGIRQQTNVVVATTESVLDPATLNIDRRISSTTMPWTAANTPYLMSGSLGAGQTLQVTFDEPYDDQAGNPFLHTYHPDHNNLDFTFNPPHEQAPGVQSYDILRTITLLVQPNSADFLSLTTGNSTLSGQYTETMTLTGVAGASRTYYTAGAFVLKQISPIATLTTQ